MGPSPAGLQCRIACPHMGWLRHGTGRVSGDGLCLLTPRTLWEVWKPRRLFCQEAERLHEYFIREAMWW